MNGNLPGVRRRSVLVTGGLGDIGLATGLRLASDGHAVTLADLADSTEGEGRVEAASRNVASQARMQYVQVDVTDAAQLDAAINGTAGLDTVIANAGTVRSAPFLDITAEDWRAQLDVNLTGAFLTAQTASRRFVLEGTPGLVLFTGSWVADVPWPEITAYIATKAALQMVARQAARELAPYGIRSNVVAPGIVRAGLAKQQLLDEPQYAARAARVVPLGDLQTPEQVAAAFSFLCSTDAEYMTGSTLLVDGGASLFAFD